jgi:hypothetical protein
MGAWSHEPFGNDDANDWAYDLEQVSDLSFGQLLSGHCRRQSMPNPALNLAPFSRWTLRDKAAQRRVA